MHLFPSSSLGLSLSLNGSEQDLDELLFTPPKTERTVDLIQVWSARDVCF